MTRKTLEGLRQELATARRLEAQELVKDAIDGGVACDKSAEEFIDSVTRLLHRIELETDTPEHAEKGEELRTELSDFIRDSINRIDLPDFDELESAVARSKETPAESALRAAAE